MNSIPIKQMSRPDGYNGSIVNVWLVFDCETGLTLEVSPSGFHNSFVPLTLGVLQSEWMIDNYPTCRNFYKAAI